MTRGSMAVAGVVLGTAALLRFFRAEHVRFDTITPSSQEVEAIYALGEQLGVHPGPWQDHNSIQGAFKWAVSGRAADVIKFLRQVRGVVPLFD